MIPQSKSALETTYRKDDLQYVEEPILPATATAEENEDDCDVKYTFRSLKEYENLVTVELLK